MPIFRRTLLIIAATAVLFGSPTAGGLRPACAAQPQTPPEALRKAIAAAQQSAAQGHFSQAAQTLTHYLQKNPGPFCARAYYDLGRYLHRANRDDAAVEALQAAVELRPGLLEAWQLLADLHRAKERFAEAASALEHATALSQDPAIRYRCALAWQRAGKPHQALPLLRQLEQAANPQPAWLTTLDEVIASLKQKQAAARKAEQAARQSGDPEQLYRAAWLWLEANRPRQALPLLQTLAAKPAPRIPWLLALSHVYMTLDRPGEAAASMEAVIDRDDRPPYLYNGALLWLQAEQPERALPHLLRLAERPDPAADWLIALGQAWLQSKNLPRAAAAMERAARISGKPGHAYHAGVLRLQLAQADAALTWLQPLQRHPQPKADWLVALARAHVLKNNHAAAAVAMEQAFAISERPEHSYQAALLWLQADRAQKALPLLQHLAATAAPQPSWLVALADTWQRLDNLDAAAATLERAATLSGDGRHYHRAAMLRRQQGQREKAVALLRQCTRGREVHQRWLVDLADLLLELDRTSEAGAVMARTDLEHGQVPDAVRFRGAILWLQLHRPRQALPILATLCQVARPAADWLTALVKTCVEVSRPKQARQALDRLLDLYPQQPDTWQLAVWLALQRSDYAEAAAAMEVLSRLTPEDADRRLDLSRYYAMAGIPTRAAELLRKTLPQQPSASDWDRLTNLYLSGQRYTLALAPAKAAVAARPSAERWETVGDILYQLGRFEPCHDAYRRASALAAHGNLLLKRGYVLLKLKDIPQAGDCFRAALALAENDIALARAARRSLTYIEQRRRQADRPAPHP